MVHAYLMYGFPTQTVQETIDSLEMVRQMFETSVLQSAFWHLFTMTSHSPVGIDPAAYKVKKQTEEIGTFANNDIQHEDPTGANHELFGYGLKKALFNYMHGTCFDFPLNKWFDFKIPTTTIAKDYIHKAILEQELTSSYHYKTIFIGTLPIAQLVQKSKKGNKWEEMQLQFQTSTNTFTISIDPKQAEWFLNLLNKLSIEKSKGLSLSEIKDSYQAIGLQDFELFWDNKPISGLHKAGLLRL